MAHDLRSLLRQTADISADFYDSLDTRPVFPRVTLEDLRAALGGHPGEPTAPDTTVPSSRRRHPATFARRLADAASASSSGHYLRAGGRLAHIRGSERQPASPAGRAGVKKGR
jgi:hypothetical protein